MRLSENVNVVPVGSLALWTANLASRSTVRGSDHLSVALADWTVRIAYRFSVCTPFILVPFVLDSSSPHLKLSGQGFDLSLLALNLCLCISERHLGIREGRIEVSYL